jgi:hypothetical protein
MWKLGPLIKVHYIDYIESSRQRYSTGKLEAITYGPLYWQSRGI